MMFGKFAQIKKTLFSMFVLLVVLFGCGKKEEPVVESKNEEPQILKTVMSMDIDSLNPYKIVSAGSEEILLNVFEGLLMPSDDGGLRNAIAESYTISEDGLKYTFKIRKGIKFHNGNTLDMNDVEFSLNRMSGKDGSPMSSSAFDNLDTITVENEDEISLTLVEANPSFIYHMIEAIVPDENKDSLDRIAIGTGPFKIAEYDREQKIVLERFDDYWGDKAHLDSVEVYVTPNVGSSFLRLMSGEINFLQYVDSKRVDEIKDYNIISSSQNMIQVMALNHNHAPFDDPRVREAINLAVDKEQIISVIMNGYGEAVETHMGPTLKDLIIPKIGITRNVERARELLIEAGHENLTFTMRAPGNYTLHVNTAQMIAEQLKEIGITMNIETIEWASWLDEVYNNRNYEATIIGLTGKLDADAVLRRYSTTYSRNFFNYSNSEYDELISKASVTSNYEERIQLYKRVQEILRDDNAAIYIMDIHNVIAIKKGFENYVFYPLPYVNFSKITIGD